MNERITTSHEANDEPTIRGTSDKPVFNWTPRSIIVATVIAVAIGLGFLLLYRFYTIVFLFFVAFSLATALKPVSTWLKEHKLPIALGVIPIYFIGILLLVAFVLFVGPIVIEQFTTLTNDLPLYYSDLRLYLRESSHRISRAVGAMLPVDLSLPIRQISEAAASDAVDPIGILGQAIGNIGKTIFLLIGVLLIAYYWLIEGETIIRHLLFRAPLEGREELRKVVVEIEHKIGAYFRGQLLLCLLIGLFCLLAFLLIGVPNALTLALISGITEAIPIIGPALGAIPAILITLSTAPEKTIWVIIALVLIQSAENYLLVPKVMDRSVGVHPLITILSIAAFGLLFGIVGAILAIPLAAILQILGRRFLYSMFAAEESLESSISVQKQTRNRFSVLRLEAEDLAQDVRKQARMRSSHEAVDLLQQEEAEDMIESLALTLQSYLLQKESAK